MNYLVTGCAGFIGYHIANSIIKKNKKARVLGIDNLNNYYSVKLKKKESNYWKKTKDLNFLNLI